MIDRSLVFSEATMGEKSNKRVSAANRKREDLRTTLWPLVVEGDLWLRTANVGFTTVPRTMCIIGRIMDQLSGKGFPLLTTYLALWCRVYDEAFVEIRNDRELAFESGFSGPRGEVTWRTRMRKLQALKFIDIKPGLASDMQYVLLYNPIRVIANTYKEQGMSEDLAYTALMTRLIEVGATDLDPNFGVR
jgi:hypothetical protein